MKYFHSVLAIPSLMALLFLTACGDTGEPVGPVDPDSPAFSLPEPPDGDTILQNWLNSISTMRIVGKDLTVWAYAPGHVTNPAKVEVYTKATVVPYVGPLFRTDVLYTRVINGVSYTDYIPDDYSLGSLHSGYGEDQDYHTFLSFNCASPDRERFGAYSNHFAKWVGPSIGAIGYDHVEGPDRVPGSGMRWSDCPLPPPPPDCPPEMTPDGDGCVGSSFLEGTYTPEDDGSDGPPPMVYCELWEYTYYNWSGGVWTPLYKWYVEECY